VRIISKFKDYYDIGLSQGVDDDVVYVREHKEVDPEHPFLSGGLWSEPLPVYRPRRYRADVEKLIVGFCGKLYPLVVIKRTLRTQHPWDTSPREKVYYCYDYDEIVKNAKKLGLQENSAPKFLRRYLSPYSPLGQIKKHFEEGAKGYEGWFQEHKVPVFIAQNKGSALLNPCLEAWEFYRVLDAWTAYQELMMYIPGVLGGTANPMVEVGEEYRIAGHGYDQRSFRMPKGAKPNRKTRKKGKK
jgi:hypothetical protein